MKILWDKKKLGGIPKERRSLEQFREALDDCNLKDMPLKALLSPGGTEGKVTMFGKGWIDSFVMKLLRI